jgi:hypothetical protein
VRNLIKNNCTILIVEEIIFCQHIIFSILVRCGIDAHLQRLQNRILNLRHLVTFQNRTLHMQYLQCIARAMM